MRGRHLVRAAVVACGTMTWSPLIAAQAVKAPPPKATPAPRPGAAVVQGFSVVLLLGDLLGGTTADNVPAAARKALVDMRDFLPYKSYRLLDTGWTLASNNSVRSTLRLRGLEQQEFELNLSGVAPPAGLAARLNLSFMLSEAEGVVPAYAEVTSRNRTTELRQSVADLESRLATFDRESPLAEKQLERVTDPAERRDAQTRRREERVAIFQQLGTARERLKQMPGEQIGAVARVNQDLEGRKVQLAELEARRRALEETLQSLKGRNDTAHPQLIQLQSELDRLSVQVAAAREGARPPFPSGRRIIDTSFSMDIGETVVVGTSRLGGGDKAIIALLTAVARAR